jgi:hypothetical protein
MGYGRALLQRDVRRESEDLQKKAKKKGLWGSIGRTIGSLGVMAITGGTVNPATLGLLTGGASFLGGAIGAKAAGGKLTGGRFMQEERKSLQKELGAFGSQNITESLSSGIKAGFGQAAKLQQAKLFGPEGAGEAAKFGKLDFEGSMVGKAYTKGIDARHASKIAKADVLYGGDKTAASKEISKGLKNYQFSDTAETFRSDIVSEGAVDYPAIENIDQVSLSGRGDYIDPSSTPFERGDFIGPSSKKPLSSSISTMPGRSTSGELGVSPYDEFGSYSGGAHYETPVDVAKAKSEKFYSKNRFGVGDKAGEVIPISEATPRPLAYGDQKVSAWDKLWERLGPTSTKDRLLQDQMRKAKGLHSFEAFYNQGNANQYQNGMTTVIRGK